MALPKKLLDQFAKITKEDNQSRTSSILYGTVKVLDGIKYVQLDGSGLLTPCVSSVNAKDGERVIVSIQNHNAIVSGNISSPAARSGDVEDVIALIKDSTTSKKLWDKLLETNTDFIYKGSDGKLYIKATFIDAGDLCGWIVDRKNKRLSATCEKTSSDDVIDLSAGSEVILDASLGLVKTVLPSTVYPGINYAAIYGNTVIADKAKIRYFANSATFAKRLTVDEQIENPNMLAGSGTNVVLTKGGFLKKSSSSFRYKKHKAFMTDADAEKIYKIRPVYFNYKEGHLAEDDEDCSRDIPGFYAELVAKYFPEAVIHNAKGQAEDWDVRKLVPAMLKLIQSQKEQLDKQEERLSKIESILKLKEK